MKKYAYFLLGLGIGIISNEIPLIWVVIGIVALHLSMRRILDVRP